MRLALSWSAEEHRGCHHDVDIYKANGLAVLHYGGQSRAFVAGLALVGEEGVAYLGNAYDLGHDVR